MYVNSTTAKRAVVAGCWSYREADDTVTIQWQNGATVRVDGAQFTATPYGRALRARLESAD